MKTHSPRALENNHRPVSRLSSRSLPSERSAFQFVDNRPEANAGKILQEIANNSIKVKQMKAYQEMADHHRSQITGQKNTLQTKLNTPAGYNASEKYKSTPDYFSPSSSRAPVQRIIGGSETAQEGESLDFTIDRVPGSKHRFRAKHVADSAENALLKTQARIDLGGNFGRRTPNFCAKEEDWTSGIEASKSVVPPADEWKKEHGNVSNTFGNSLLKASVKGWMVRDASKKDEDPIDLKAVEGSTTQSLGGDWWISGLDETGETVTGDADVDVDIFHVDGH